MTPVTILPQAVLFRFLDNIDDIFSHSGRFSFESGLVREDGEQESRPDHADFDFALIFKNRDSAWQGQVYFELDPLTPSALSGLQRFYLVGKIDSFAS